MSIAQIFNRGLDGLTVNMRGMAVTSNNIANLNSPGYARQVINIGSRATAGGSGGGAEVIGVSSITNAFVEAQLFNTANSFGTLDGRQRVLTQLESVFNEAVSGGMGKALSDFFQSFQDLANDAGSTSARQAVKEKALTLTQKFGLMSTQLTTMRTSLVDEMSARVEKINALASSIAQLNETIVQTPDKTSTIDLVSQRQYYLRQLSEEANISYYESENGSIQVQIDGGTALVTDFTAGTMSLTDDPSVNGTATVSLQLPGSTSSIDITNRLTSGRLGGNLIDRNTTLIEKRQALDTMAYEFVTAFNTLHRTGYGISAGATTGTKNNNNFFTVLGTSTGAAAAISVHSDILSDVQVIGASSADPATAGISNNVVALQLAAFQNTKILNGNTETVSQYYQGLVGEVGVLVGTNQKNFETQTGLLSQIELQRESISGVNLDEEGANLIRFQKAFQASSRLLSMADQMLEDLLRI